MNTSWRAGPRTLLRSWFDPSRWLARLDLGACDVVGAGARALGRPIVYNDGRIEIGRDVTVRSVSSPVRLVTTTTGSISIGDGAVIEAGTHIFAAKRVVLGNGVVVGPRVVISDRNESGVAADVVVEDGARIGAGARLVGPCVVARDAVVAPGSVVRGGAPESEVRTTGATEGAANGISVRHEPPHDPGTNGATTKKAASGGIRRVRTLLAADWTVNELAEHLGGPTEDGLLVEAEVAPFDQVVPTLLTLSSREPKVDLAVLWTRPERACRSFHELLLGGTPSPEQILAEVDAFASLLRAHAGGARFVFVPSWVLPPWRRGTGMLELRGTARASAVLMRMNLRLADAASELPNVFVLDAQRWLAAAADGGFDAKLWHAGKIAFTTDVLSEAGSDIHAALRGLLGMSRKLVIIDLDDTMWGGIVGDVGWENLRLGGHDPDGEAFVQFQRQLVALTKRGIALAVVSKNEESTAIEAMRSHPEMIIRPEMLAAYRINWRDKAQNIVEIAQELNLGLQSVVFLDDNPAERGRVREALPEVYVPDWPIDPTHYPQALESLRCFDAPHVSAEDVERNAMYAVERERTALRNKVSSIDEWLATLGVSVRFEKLSPSNVARAAQLLNKTNQMNLRTRRLSEVELLTWAGEPGHELWTAQVSDRFGNAGLTGLLGLECRGPDAQITDFVLSCRVMGRRVEETMVWAGRRRAGALGATRVVVVPIPTAKNKPCLDFFANRYGVTSASPCTLSALGGADVAPAAIRVEGLP